MTTWCHEFRRPWVWQRWTSLSPVSRHPHTQFWPWHPVERVTSIRTWRRLDWVVRTIRFYRFGPIVTLRLKYLFSETFFASFFSIEDFGIDRFHFCKNLSFKIFWISAIEKLYCNTSKFFLWKDLLVFSFACDKINFSYIIMYNFTWFLDLRDFSARSPGLRDFSLYIKVLLQHLIFTLLYSFCFIISRSMWLCKFSLIYAGISESGEPRGIDRGVRVWRCDSDVAGETPIQFFSCSKLLRETHS